MADGGAKLIVEDGDVPDLTLYQKRINICNTCEYKNPVGICNKCGCVLAVKARFPVFNCPLRKW